MEWVPIRMRDVFRCERGFTVTLFSSSLLELRTGTLTGKMICMGFGLKYQEKLANIDHSFARKLHLHSLSPSCDGSLSCPLGKFTDFHNKRLNHSPSGLH